MGLLSRMFRRGRSTIHEILDDTCPAIHTVLKDEYLKVGEQSIFEKKYLVLPMNSD